MSETRHPANLLLCLVTIVTLFLAVNMTDNFTIKILKDFSVGFDSFGIDMPNYTDYVDENTYLAGRVLFDPKALVGFYHLTNNFIDSVLEPNCLNEDMFDWDLSGTTYIPTLKVSHNSLMKEYWVLVFIVAIIVVITVIIPIIGIIFCCCRCCGNCGAKSLPSDPKRDNCTKFVQGTLVISLATLLLMTVVCAFATNQQMQEGTHEFPDNIRKSYKDSMTYLKSLDNQSSTLLSTNYQEFALVFKSTIQNSGKNVMEQMTSWEKASAMLELYNFVEGMPNITSDLNTLQQNIEKLKLDGSTVSTEVGTIKTRLTTTLSQCLTIPLCKKISDDISSLQFEIVPSQIPEVTSAIVALGGLNTDNLKAAAKAGKASIDNVENQINSILVTIINSASEQIDDAGITIQNILHNMTDVMEDLRTQINQGNSTLEDGYEYITTYSPYFYYFGLTISCILLLILTCIILGLLWGICGKRPLKYSPTTCTKETGSMFLISGAFLMFTFTVVVGLLTTAMLIIGLAADRGICFPLRNPEESTIIKIIDDYVSKNVNVDLDLNVSQILTRCRNNDSIYRVFNLSSRYNIDNLYTELDINKTVDDIITQITTQLGTIIPSSFNILSDSELNALRVLETINPEIPIDEFEKALNHNVTNVNVQELIVSLEELGKLLNSTNPSNPNLITQVDSEIENIQIFKNSILLPFENLAQETLVSARVLNEDLKMNSSSFSAAITKFINDVINAQDEIRLHSDQLVTAAKAFGDLVIIQVQGYLQRIINVTNFELGQCGPLNVAINATLIATCDKIVQPWNGFWVSLFISLLIFVPLMIFSITLASLYKKFKISKEYIGGERFKLSKKFKKGKHGHYPKTLGDRPYPPTTRYNEMAPKLQPEETSTRF